MRLALVPCNPTVGDLPANRAMLADRLRDAAEHSSDLIVFPELALTGYPPRDLLLQEGFLEAVRDEATALAKHVGDQWVLVGAPWKSRRASSHPPSSPSSQKSGTFDPAGVITNSVLIMHQGAIVARYDKRLLPTYDVFDEDRYFHPGDQPVVIDVAGVRVGISICEDLWRAADVGAADRYAGEPDPVAELVRAGARLVVNPSASPFFLSKGQTQRDILTRHVADHSIAIAAVNQLGGNDDLIFDGHAVVYLPTTPNASNLVAVGDAFAGDTVYVDIPADDQQWSGVAPINDPLLTSHPMHDLWRALTLGVRDYLYKTGFSTCVLGLSGGIDSAVTACIAAGALGADNVLGVAMPSRYSSPGSVHDAEALAHTLHCKLVAVPITDAHAIVEQSLQPAFLDVGVTTEQGVAEENIQARLRGLVLMAFSNKINSILLTTGNKSELAVGYCTLYGDMNGGLAVLADVTKVQVYELARWINDNHTTCNFPSPPIPESTLTKPPSAELRPDQTDQDTLPPYDILDEVVDRYVEGRQSISRITRETGFEADLVQRIVRLIDINEYKRKQMPVGLKVTNLAFGKGRRRPIAQRYHPK